MGEIDPEELKRRIIKDMRVELAEEFDRNFQRKGFFSTKWKPRAANYPRGTLLMVTGTLRRSIKATETENGVRFSSSVPYAAVHNEGGKGAKSVREHSRRSRKGKSYTVRAHTRKFNMPKRQFVGDGPKTRELIKGVIDDNLKKFNLQLGKFIKESKKD